MPFFFFLVFIIYFDAKDRFFVSLEANKYTSTDEQVVGPSRLQSNNNLESQPHRGSTTTIVLSKDPYNDFRQSMLEMMDAKQREEEGNKILESSFMEELLKRYLEFNDPSVHKEILRAFSDLASSFRFMAK